MVCIQDKYFSHALSFREYYNACLSGKRMPILVLIEAFSGGVADGCGSAGSGPSSPQLLVSVPTSRGLTLQQVMPYLKKLAPGGPLGGVCVCMCVYVCVCVCTYVRVSVCLSV